MPPDDADLLLKTAESRLHHLNIWWPRLWAWNCWLLGTSVILSGFVPFGLALLLYMPPEHTRVVNIILIVCSAFGFVAQVWNATQRNRDRAGHLRRVAGRLEAAVASYRSDVIKREEFASEFRKALAQEANEPAP